MKQIGNNIWFIDGEIVDFYGFPYSTRSVVIRLKNDDLWVWSPIQLSEALSIKVKKLGNVKHLVSPNKLHYLYLKEWSQAFPKALLWGPQSTVKKCSSLQFEAALQDQAPSFWKEEIDQYCFNGSWLFEEVVFFHKESKTAIFADLSENFSDEYLKKHWKGWKARVARLWKITEPYGYAPLELRLSWLNKKADREKMKNLLAGKPEKVIMAHGEWKGSDGSDYIKSAFQWLL